MQILIIKFGALGDVLRTTTLLRPLKNKYPHCRISWLTQKASVEVLKRNSLVSKLYEYSGGIPKTLLKQKFGLLINLDKDKEALVSAEKIKAGLKKGFGRDANGKIRPFDRSSEYAYRLGIDDELKFKKNKKTYQKISFEQAGLTYAKEEYIFSLDKKDKQSADARLVERGLDDNKFKIGIVTGRGNGFCGKCLPDNYYVKIIDGLSRDPGIQILLLGGPRETGKNKKILRKTKDSAIDTGCDNTIGRYAAIINKCDLIITGDTLSLHLAIALKKPVIVFFGSTAQQEIDLYNRGTKLKASIKCAPCYKKKCPIGERCMQEFTPEKIINLTRKYVISAKK